MTIMMKMMMMMKISVMRMIIMMTVKNGTVRLLG